jgi:hypothetical protein
MLPRVTLQLPRASHVDLSETIQMLTPAVVRMGNVCHRPLCKVTEVGVPGAFKELLPAQQALNKEQ